MPTVARWCARLGGPWVDPEDAAQDVLATAARRLDSLEDPERLESWLFSITRRTLAQHRRRVWWRRWLPGAVPDRVDGSDGPEAAAIASRRVARVHHWLEALPAAQREAVVLCALEERSAAEAAGILGLPEGTVRSRLRLGMARLRTLAGEDR